MDDMNTAEFSGFVCLLIESLFVIALMFFDWTDYAEQILFCITLLIAMAGLVMSIFGIIGEYKAKKSREQE